MHGCMNVWRYECMNGWMCEGMYACMCACMCVGLYMCICTYVCVYVCIYLSVVFMYVCMYVRVCVCVYCSSISFVDANFFGGCLLSVCLIAFVVDQSPRSFNFAGYRRNDFFWKCCCREWCWERHLIYVLEGLWMPSGSQGQTWHQQETPNSIH